MAEIIEFPKFTSYSIEELEEYRLSMRVRKLDKLYRQIYLALLRGYRLPYEYCMFCGKYNKDAPVYYNPDDDFLYFLTRDCSLAKMPLRLAKNFNWNVAFSYNLADLAEDLLDPYNNEIVYRGGDKYVS